MKIAISAESTVDLSKEQLEEFNIKTVPFTVLLGDEVRFDGDVSTDDIISYVDKSKILVKTSAVNSEQYREYFSALLKDNDAVIHFCLSSELSSAYNNAVNVAKEFNNVFVIDSRTLSTGIALLCLYARELADKDVPAEEIVSLCEKRIPYVQASFVLKRLDYLYKGGRCSALSFFGANLLKIRPQIIVSDGKMITGKKYRGNFKSAIKSYCTDILEQFDTPDKSVVILTYTTASEEELLTAKEILTDAGFEKIILARAGATITSHCGENCLGILYINDGKK